MIWERRSLTSAPKAAPDYDFPMRRPERNLTELVPAELIRKEDPKLPQVSQIEVVRHYTRLSRMNYGVDNGIYPLGSCTMKYNPRINEDMARLAGFAYAIPCRARSSLKGLYD
jgi:glycine dehydrogenase subunit 2